MSNGQHVYTARRSTAAAAAATNKRIQKRQVISNNAVGIRPPPSGGPALQLVHRNSKKTAYILTTLLVLSLCLQLMLLFHHDELVAVQTMMTSMTDEIVGDLELVDEEMVDMLNAAYEYNNNKETYYNDVDSIISETIAKYTQQQQDDKNSPPTIKDFCGTCRFRNQDFNCNHRIEWVMKNRGKTEEEAKLDNLQYCVKKKATGGNTKKQQSGPQAPFQLLDKSDWDKYTMEPLQILQRAGVDPNEGFTPSMRVMEVRQAARANIKIEKQQAQLPTLTEIQSLYGTKPYILGLERCQAYRDAVDPEFRLIGPAGLFNSATNLVGNLLKMNCINSARLKTKKYRAGQAPSGVKIQAPWGKHNPVSWRLHHEATVGGAGTKQEDFLPIVMIKDPLTWMASMCRHSYEARWRHFSEHCPNLVANEFDKGKELGEIIPVFVKFATQHIGDEPILMKTAQKRQ